MTVVKELNELAYKMTGVNPKAKTDQQALNYIEQHYQGGQPSPTPQSKFDYIIPKEILVNSSGEITDTDIINVLDEINSNYLDEDGNVKPLMIGCYLKNNEEGEIFSFAIVYEIRKSLNAILNIYTYLGNSYRVSIDKQYGKWWVLSSRLE